MSIRNKIAAVRAPKKKRAAVQVANEAQAARVRRDWAVEDAIRDTNARVMALADHADNLVASAIRTTAADAVAERRASQYARAEHERDGGKHNAHEDACHAEYDERVKKAAEEHKRANDAAYADYCRRHRRVNKDNFQLFPATLAEKDKAAYRAKVKPMTREAFYDLIEAEHDQQRERNQGVYDAEVEAADIALAAQLAAIDSGEGLIIVAEDGTVTETANEFD